MSKGKALSPRKKCGITMSVPGTAPGGGKFREFLSRHFLKADLLKIPPSDSWPYEPKSAYKILYRASETAIKTVEKPPL